METRWMLKCFYSIHKDLVVGDLEHAWARAHSST